MIVSPDNAAQVLSVIMITSAANSLHTKLRIECMGLGPSLFGGILASCTREVGPDQSPASTVVPKCERATSEFLFASCRRDREQNLLDLCRLLDL